MKKYLTVFTFFFSSLLSCTENNIDPNIIRKIAQEDVKIPSQYSNVAFFCKGGNNTILFLDIYQLRELHKNEFSNIDYYDFLKSVLKQKIVIKSTQYNSFKIDKTVDSLYNKMDINKFRDFFCIKEGDTIYYLKRDVIDIERNTVLYYLFIHNYLIRLDDYTGAFVIRKSN